jgi:hypothetical protein
VNLVVEYAVQHMHYEVSDDKSGAVNYFKHQSMLMQCSYVSRSQIEYLLRVGWIWAFSASIQKPLGLLINNYYQVVVLVRRSLSWVQQKM